MKIAVLTTATNRVDLHKLFLESLLFSNFFVDIEVNWFINIDVIDKFDDSFDEVKKNFENFINKYFDKNGINEIFFIKTEQPSFLNAAKNLLNISTSKNFNYDYYLWLEDDWILFDENVKLLDIILKTQHLDFDTLSLFERDRACNFNPTIMTNKIANELLRALSMYSDGDPEKVFSKHCADLVEKHVIYKKIFIDIGRSWIRSRSQDKNRDDKMNVFYS